MLQRREIKDELEFGDFILVDGNYYRIIIS